MIRELPEQEVRSLANWLQAYVDDLWDKQMEADLNSGKLDRLLAKAEADIAVNKVRDLDEILNNDRSLESKCRIDWSLD